MRGSHLHNLIFLVRAFVFLDAFIPGFAQQTSPLQTNRTEPAATISGFLIDADSGARISQTLRVRVLSPSGKEVAQSNDAKGSYRLSVVSPGTYQVEVLEMDSPFRIAQRTVTVTANADISVDMRVRLSPMISGVITNSEKQPVEAARVFLVTSEYVYGHRSYYAEQDTKTDDLGQYNFSRHVSAGRSYLLLALPPIVETQEERIVDGAKPQEIRETRHAVLGAAWFPDVPLNGDGSHFGLLSGERRRFDLTLPNSGNYCVDGKLTSNGAPSAVKYEVAVKEISGFVPADGPSMGVVRSGKASAGGLFTVCGLWPGEFRLTVGTTPDQYGYTLFSIGDKDLHGLTADARSSVTLRGEIAEDFVAKNSPKPSASVFMLPVNRHLFGGELFRYQAQVSVPGSFTLVLPAMTEYWLSASLDGNSYIRQMVCDDAQSPYQTVEVTDRACKVRIQLASDAGTVTANVLDNQDKPVLEASTCLFPETVVTKEELAYSLFCSQADPTTGISIKLPPGRYEALVPPLSGVIDLVDFLWQRKSEALVVEVAPKGHSKITLRTDTEER